ncbi:MAG: hypothetical protein A2Y62_20540, partial [Candidatus Fischerbacteria bacterium RBG_13_37_8]
MDFREVLNQIMQKLDDAYGLFLMGYDGIAIEKSLRSCSLNLDMLAAEYTNFLRVIDNSLASNNAGNLDELINVTDNVVILLKLITNEYFLFMVMNKDANFGRA